MMIKTVWSQRLKDCNHSLSKLIQAQQYFTQGHSAVFRLLEVFILRFLKTGTPTLLSSPNIRLDPAP